MQIKGDTGKGLKKGVRRGDGMRINLLNRKGEEGGKKK